MRQSVHNLMEFPFVRDAVAAGTLEAGTYTHPLFGSTSALIVGQGVFKGCFRGTYDRGGGGVHAFRGCL